MKKKDVLKYFGNSVQTAKALGITKQAVHYWPDEIPLGRACEIELLTNGALKAKRPKKKRLN